MAVTVATSSITHCPQYLFTFLLTQEDFLSPWTSISSLKSLPEILSPTESLALRYPAVEHYLSRHSNSHLCFSLYAHSRGGPDNSGQANAFMPFSSRFPRRQFPIHASCMLFCQCKVRDFFHIFNLCYC